MAQSTEGFGGPLEDPGAHRPVGQWQPRRCRTDRRGLERAAHRFRAWLPRLLRANGQDGLPVAVRWRQGQPGRGHQECTRDVERIEPTGQKAGQEGVTMASKSKRRKIKVAPYDSADYLKTEADIKNYLEAVFEEPVDRQMLIHTLGVVARARGMMKLSKDTGITRAGLYKALSPNGNPSFETVTKIVGAFGMRLSAQAA